MTKSLMPYVVGAAVLLFLLANTLFVVPQTAQALVLQFGGVEQVINAPTQGDVIREMAAFTGFWGAHYAGAGRVRR